MTTKEQTPTTTERVEKRLVELTTERAKRQDADDLPRTMSEREVRAYVARTAELDRQIAAIRGAAARVTALGTGDDDIAWLAHLTAWRETLSTELLAMHPRIRNDKELDQKLALEWSIKVIDFGFAAARLPIVTLSPTKIGELMAAAGYATSGPDLRGPHGWRGSIREADERIKALTRERAEAEAALDRLLMSDKEHAKVEAETQARRDALNTMDVKGNADGTGLVAFTKDGDPLSLADMTPAQKAAFTWFEAAAYAPREPVEQ